MGNLDKIALSILNLPQTLSDFQCVYQLIHKFDMWGRVMAVTGTTRLLVNSSRSGLEQVTCHMTNAISNTFIDASKFINNNNNMSPCINIKYRIMGCMSV